MAEDYSNSVKSQETLSSRKRKLEMIMKNEPDLVTRYPMRLWSTRQNIDVASNFYEVWLDEKFEKDLLYCQRSQKILTRQKRHNSNLVRHRKLLMHKSDNNPSSYNQNEEWPPSTLEIKSKGESVLRNNQPTEGSPSQTEAPHSAQQETALDTLQNLEGNAVHTSSEEKTNEKSYVLSTLSATHSAVVDAPAEAGLVISITKASGTSASTFSGAEERPDPPEQNINSLSPSASGLLAETGLDKNDTSATPEITDRGAERTLQQDHQTDSIIAPVISSPAITSGR